MISVYRSRLERSVSFERELRAGTVGYHRYHARMARRAQHLRCSLRSYVREANERTTGWISITATMCSKFLHLHSTILVLPHHDQNYSIFNIIYYIVSFRTSSSCFCQPQQSTVFSGKGLKFCPIRSEKTVPSRFWLVEI